MKAIIDTNNEVMVIADDFTQIDLVTIIKNTGLPDDTRANMGTTNTTVVDLSTLTNVPTDVNIPFKYLYIGGVFTVNPKYNPNPILIERAHI
jgi:hypothetical protein